MTASIRAQLRAEFAGDGPEPSYVQTLSDAALALRLDAIRASNGTVYDRPTRNQIIAEAANRLRAREEEQ